MASRWPEMALLKNTWKIDIFVLTGPQQHQSFVFGLFVRVVFIFRKQLSPTFSLSASRLKNLSEISFFGLNTLHDVSRCFKSCRIFFDDFHMVPGGPQKHLKKQRKLILFGLDCSLTSRFYDGANLISQMLHRL